MFDFYFNLKIPLNFSDKVVDKHFFTQLATFPFTVEVCKRREVHVKSVRKAKMQPKTFSVGTEVSACGVQLCIWIFHLHPEQSIISSGLFAQLILQNKTGNSLCRVLILLPPGYKAFVPVSTLIITHRLYTPICSWI